MLTDRTCGIRSVRSRRPFGSTSRTMCGCVTIAWESRSASASALRPCRKSLTDRELEEHAHHNTRVNCAARKLSRVSVAARIDRLHLAGNAAHRMSASCVNVAELDLQELESALETRGRERFHARQLYRWIYKRGVVDFDAMTDLSKEMRASLPAEFEVITPRVVNESQSVDGTRKFVLELRDQRRIEAVFIPDTPAMTFCISTQVGCAMGCGFCLTGKMGLLRNLTAGEIAGQVRVLAAATGM